MFLTELTNIFALFVNIIYIHNNCSKDVYCLKNISNTKFIKHFSLSYSLHPGFFSTIILRNFLKMDFSNMQEEKQEFVPFFNSDFSISSLISWNNVMLTCYGMSNLTLQHNIVSLSHSVLPPLKIFHCEVSSSFLLLLLWLLRLSEMQVQ